MRGLLLSLCLGLVLAVSPLVGSTLANADAAADVSVTPGSNINLVARETRIPVTVENLGTEPATVTVNGKATSFRLDVLGQAEITIPAGSSVVAELPVKAIANGPVTLRIWLTKDGEQIGTDYFVAVNVNYDVEVFLLVSFGVVVSALLVIGVVRTGRRLRQRRG